jgi:hypothetical protein
MAVERFAIEETTLPFGKAEVFFGDAETVDGMDALGLIEGDVAVAIARKFNSLTYEEHTGAAPLKQTVQTDSVTVTIPILLTDKTMIDRLSPTGELDFGSDNFKPVVPQTLLIVSQDEVDPTTGLSYGPAVTPVWAPAAPKNALWIWKAVLGLDSMVWGFTDQGKRFVNVPVTAMYDTTKPDKHKLATFGDPVTQGITTIRL